MLTRLLLTSSVILTIGCAISTGPDRVGYQVPRQPVCVAMYTFGDATYDKKLRMGMSPVKLGPIPADSIPQGFPAKFLEADGSYGGGRVFCTIAEAQQGIIEAHRQGLLSAGKDSGIYQLVGDWDSYSYQLHPNDFRLRRSTTVLRRVR